MNFVVGLPKSQRMDVIMVVVDRLTKYVHFMGLSYPYSATKVATLFVQNVLKLHGLSTSIVSDWDLVFIARFWVKLFKLQGVQLAISSTYHPQSDEQTEVVNKSLKHYLRSFLAKRPTKWVKWLYLAKFWFNTNYHTTTKMTLWEALYGFSPPKLVDYVPDTT